MGSSEKEKSLLSAGLDRRDFVKVSAAAGIGYWVSGGIAAPASKAPSEQINFACIGVGGKGESDSNDAASHGNIVAICDVDETRLNKYAEEYMKRGEGRKEPKKYTDFRKMFEEMGKEFDACTVSTPDHTHAVASVMAMKHGKHVYCQKPLTHSIYEARVMADVAKKQGVATQMGNQGTANSGVRKAAQLIQDGVLGTVTEVHVWTNRPIWPQGIKVDYPTSEPKTPSGLNWDCFLGPAKERPYSSRFHPFKWRGWWAFGTGALGDMACHTMNMPFMGLDLRDPISAEPVECDPHNKATYPKSTKIKLSFGQRGNRKPLDVYWYDGGRLPSEEVMQGKKAEGSGCLIIGDKGRIYSPNDYGAEFTLLPEDNFKDFKDPEWKFEVSPGHFEEWVRAIRGGKPAMSNFPDYAGPLTETVLMGNLCVWAGKKIEWDAKNMVATNAPELAEMIKHEYRPGWEL
jgi:predicted dehydrogenase